jgi:Flp pilus assembly protein TadG
MRSQRAAEQSKAAKRSDRGQTLVEFAMVISILFLFILGIFEFSRLFFAFGTMSHGVREAARFAVVNPGSSAVAQRAQDTIFLIGGTANVTVTYPDEVNGNPYCSHRCRVQVRATSTYTPWTPLIPSFEMFAQTTLHIE